MQAHTHTQCINPQRCWKQPQGICSTPHTSHLGPPPPSIACHPSTCTSRLALSQLWLNSYLMDIFCENFVINRCLEAESGHVIWGLLAAEGVCDCDCSCSHMFTKQQKKKRWSVGATVEQWRTTRTTRTTRCNNSALKLFEFFLYFHKFLLLMLPPQLWGRGDILIQHMRRRRRVATSVLQKLMMSHVTLIP